LDYLIWRYRLKYKLYQKLNIIGNALIKTIEEIFYNINEHMLETKYIMGLGQLLKITPYLKWYLWKKKKKKKKKLVISTMMPKLVIENTHIATNGVVMETCRCNGNR
jgi:hypothetical protein